MPKGTSKTQPQDRPASRTGNLLTIAGAVVLVALAIVAVVLMFRGGGNSPSVRHNAHQAPVVATSMQVTVDVVDNDFTPSGLTVKKGASVTWRSKGSVIHTVTEDNGAFGSGALKKDDTFEHTFDTVGTFYYYCTVHHVMTGSVTVTD